MLLVPHAGRDTAARPHPWRPMPKNNTYRAILADLDDWDAYLQAESGLPGPRGNLELAQAVADVGNPAIFQRYAAITAEEAPSNTPGEFLAFCGVVGLGRLVAEGHHELLPTLRHHASDPRWRLREAVAMALQRLGDADMDRLLAEMRCWAQGSPLEQRAAAAALCEPRLLAQPAHARATLDILDAISIPVRPTHYLTIHPRVRRMTRLGQEELCDAPEFLEAMDRFTDWCGEDYVFLTWGCDDVSVLQQNVDFFQFQRPLPKMYDIQRLYAQVQGLKANQQKGLKSAMEQLEIQEDEDRSFHNAMHDAYYTALVLKKLPDPSAVLAFEEQPREFCHNPKRSRVRINQTVPSVAAALASPAIQTPECPTCKKPTLLQTEVIPQAVGKYTALSK